MSDDISEELEEQKLKFVMLQNKINNINAELQNLITERERMFGLIRYLESKKNIKKDD